MKEFFFFIALIVAAPVVVIVIVFLYYLTREVFRALTRRAARFIYRAWKEAEKEVST